MGVPNRVKGWVVRVQNRDNMGKVRDLEPLKHFQGHDLESNIYMTCILNVILPKSDIYWVIYRVLQAGKRNFERG